MSIWITPLIIVCALLLFALAYLFLHRKYPSQPGTLIDAVDALLPQTQCAQCGYPGCRPYAEAVVANEAPLNLCPPGGDDVHQALITLMGEQQPSEAPVRPQTMVAYIDERQCIGCTLCLPPCPVDAIVGSSNQMHTVIAAECTGCELCIPACPVDCISLQATPQVTPKQAKRRATQPASAARGCINCGQCNDVCPVLLPAQDLFHAVNAKQPDTSQSLGLAACIECGLCDRACPSDIALAGIFGRAKTEQQHHQAEEAAKTHYKDRFAAHVARLAQEDRSSAEKRANRLQNTGRWS